MLSKIIVITIVLFISISSATRDEIDHLLLFVANTQCSFIRNGDSHSGKDAVKHIQKKYAYYDDDIESAEDFIRLSATKSSMSGKKYRVKCDSLSLLSSTWLIEELETYRDTVKTRKK